MKNKPAVVLLLWFCFFQSQAFCQDFISKEAAEDSNRKMDDIDYSQQWSSLNEEQPIPVGGTIYTITNLEAASEEIETSRYRKERIWEIKKYIYTGFEDGSIKVLYSSSYERDVEDTMVRYGSGTDSGSRTKGGTETKDISIRLDSKKRGLLDTVDAKTFIVTVVDEDNRITVEER